MSVVPRTSLVSQRDIATSIFFAGLGALAIGLTSVTVGSGGTTMLVLGFALALAGFVLFITGEDDRKELMLE